MVCEAMLVHPHMFCDCGTSCQLAHIDKTASDKSPCCSTASEAASHITWCLSPGCSEMFLESTDCHFGWLYEMHMDSPLVCCITSYLHALEDGSMIDLT